MMKYDQKLHEVKLEHASMEGQMHGTCYDNKRGLLDKCMMHVMDHQSDQKKRYNVTK